MRELTRVASSAAEASALEAEARALETLDLPGLPVVVRCGPGRPAAGGGTGPVEIVTAVPPGVPLADRLPLRPLEAAGVTLALATILTDLAAAGVARDLITIDQVHLIAGGRPVLATLPGARFPGARLRGDAPVPPAGAGELGGLLLRMLAPPAPRRPWQLGGDDASPLRTLAHRAADPAMALELFLERLRAAVPDARLPAIDAVPDRAVDEPDRPQVQRPPQAARLAAVTAIMFALLGSVVAFGWHATSRSSVEAAPGPVPPTTSVGQAFAEAVWPAPDCATSPMTEACRQLLRVDGPTVWLGTRSWRIDGAGRYVLTVADLDCSGEHAVLALDVEVGELWRADPDRLDAPMTPIGNALGAQELRPDPAGCGPPLLTHANGTPAHLERNGQ